MDDARRDAFAGRMAEAGIGALDLLHVYVGDRLGLYRAMASGEPVSPRRLAADTGIAMRYAREWLEHQAIARIVEVHRERGEADDRAYVLPAEHADVLTNETSLGYVAPLALGVAGVARTLPLVLDAFRRGTGVPYEAFGADLRDAISRGNRPMFTNLVGVWFAAIPDLAERLNAEPPARVADVGCGAGWSSIAVARAFPRAMVHGLDADAASIEEARTNATAAGVGERVTFTVGDAADPRLAGGYDLVSAFETIHDMCDPVAALRAMRALRADGGTVLVVDERVADSFTVDVEGGERFQSGWSALHCLPLALLEPPAAGTGTLMRLPTLRGYAVEAGFRDVEVLPVENELWRFYRLVG